MGKNRPIILNFINEAQLTIASTKKIIILVNALGADKKLCGLTISTKNKSNKAIKIIN